MYQYKVRDEILWALLSGFAIFATETLVGFKPEEIQDPKTWALVAVGALVRSLTVALLAAFGKAQLAREKPAPKRRKRKVYSSPAETLTEARAEQERILRGIDGPR